MGIASRLRTYNALPQSSTGGVTRTNTANTPCAALRRGDGLHPGAYYPAVGTRTVPIVRNRHRYASASPRRHYRRSVQFPGRGSSATTGVGNRVAGSSTCISCTKGRRLSAPASIQPGVVRAALRDRGRFADCLDTQAAFVVRLAIDHDLVSRPEGPGKQHL